MNSTITADAVRKIHADHEAYDPKHPTFPFGGTKPAGWNPKQSTRTEVHALLQKEFPALAGRGGDATLWNMANKIVDQALAGEGETATPAAAVDVKKEGTP